jgi:hypothetical protein
VEFKKETPKVKAGMTAHALTVSTTSSINILLPKDGAKPFMLGLAELFNQSDLFAQHGSLMLGINGPEAIVLSRSILKHVTIEPNQSMFDELFKLLDDSDADRIVLIIADLPALERTLIGTLTVDYFNAKDNDFKPTKAMFEKSACDCADCKTMKPSKK